MKSLLSLQLVLLWLALAAAPGLPAAAAELAQVRYLGDNIEWEPADPRGRYQLTVGGGGLHSRALFGAGSRPAMALFDAAGQPLPDGVYTWRLELLPAPIAAAWEPGSGRDRQPGSPPPPDPLPSSIGQSGFFRILGGTLVTPAEPESPTDDRDR